AGGQRLLHVEAGGLLAADGQVVDQDVDARVAEDLGNVNLRLVGLGDDVGKGLADAVEGAAAAHLDPQGWDLGGAGGVVGLGQDGLGEVFADLGGVDVEGGDELDVADVVAAEVDVHEAGDGLVLGSVVVLGDALDE